MQANRPTIRLDAQARRDLRRLDAATQDAIIEVISGHLRIPTDSNDPDEGSWRAEKGAKRHHWSPFSKPVYYYFRKGITRERRQELNEAERRGDDLDTEDATRPWDYSIVYRETTSSECIRHRCGRGYTVMRVFANRELVFALRGRFPDVMNRL